MRTYVVGGSTFDLLATELPYLPSVDEAGDEFTHRSLVHVASPFLPCVGGNGANAAMVLAHLGGSVQLCTAFGSDLFGNWLAEHLHAAGVHIHPLPATETSVNVILVDGSSHRLSAFRGVDLDVASTVAAAAAADVAAGDAVLIAGYPHPPLAAMEAWTRKAKDARARVALDIGPPVAGWTESSLKPVLPWVDILLANTSELAAMVPDAIGDDVAEHLAYEYDLAVVCKSGRMGARYVAPGAHVETAAFNVDDAHITVGAGDAFNAGFLFQVGKGAGTRLAMRYGAAVSALVIERGAGVLGAPTAAQVDAFLQQMRTDDVDRSDR